MSPRTIIGGEVVDLPPEPGQEQPADEQKQPHGGESQSGREGEGEQDPNEHAGESLKDA